MLLSKLTSLINQGEFIPSAWVNRSCIFSRPFECVVECYFNGVTHSGFERTKIIWSNPERFSVWSGALATAGDVVFYGTLEGYFKAVDAKTGAELYRFKTPSGIIGNVMTYMHNGKQYLAVYSGIGGWAGIGMAAGIDGDGNQGAYKGEIIWFNLEFLSVWSGAFSDSR